jgi:hypothetical protein
MDKSENVVFGDRYCIGIDPGTQTGVAVWNVSQRRFESISTLSVHGAILMFEDLLSGLHCGNVVVYLEDPNTWKGFGLRSEGIARSQGAGSIKRDFAIWRDYFYDRKVRVVPVRLQGTLKKLEAGKFAAMTGWTSRTSKHARDAALMVFNR